MVNPMHSPHRTSSTLDERAVKAVRAALEESGRSQSGLARVLGITQASVSRRRSYTFGELVSIEQWLGVPLIDQLRDAS